MNYTRLQVNTIDDATNVIAQHGGTEAADWAD
jgi:hypothetical protein